MPFRQRGADPPASGKNDAAKITPPITTNSNPISTALQGTSGLRRHRPHGVHMLLASDSLQVAIRRRRRTMMIPRATNA